MVLSIASPSQHHCATTLGLGSTMMPRGEKNRQHDPAVYFFRLAASLCCRWNGTAQWCCLFPFPRSIIVPPHSITMRSLPLREWDSAMVLSIASPSQHHCATTLGLGSMILLSIFFASQHHCAAVGMGQRNGAVYFLSLAASLCCRCRN
jgi:hypothetical protein